MVSVEERSAEFAALYAELFGAAEETNIGNPPTPPAPVDLDDAALLEKIRRSKNGDKFFRLWAGDTSDHRGDESSADLGLMNSLAFWTGRDAAKMERLFSQSRLGQRDKWRDRADYRSRTIQKAIDDCSEIYNPARQRDHLPARTAWQISGNLPGTRKGKAASLDARRQAITPVVANLAGEAKLCSDLGNGARFAILNFNNVRYSFDRDTYLAWIGTHWAWDRGAIVGRLAQTTVLSIFDEIQEASRAASDALARNDDQAAAKHSDRVEALNKHAKKSQDNSPMQAMLKQARPHLAITLDQLDADPWILNCLNGAVDLRTGELRAHCREDFCTRIVHTNYTPEAQCPLWRSFLARTFGGNVPLIEYMQRLAGLFLTADVSVQKFWVFYGTGGNGKSIFLDTTRGIMGDYSGIAPESLVTARKSEEHPCELASIAGKRFVVASETEGGAALRLQLIKRMTGDGELTARWMYGEYFTFFRTFKMVLVTNNRPRVPETTEGAWRRIELVPFSVVIPDDERDPDLLEKLRDEWPGILSWMVAGCLAWQRDGLGAPPAVTDATEAYRTEQDSIGEFITKCCVTGEKLTAYAKDLYEAFVKWIEAADERPISQRRFGSTLNDRGLVSERCSYSNRRKWRGIGLKLCQNDSQNASNGSEGSEKTDNRSEDFI